MNSCCIIVFNESDLQKSLKNKHPQKTTTVIFADVKIYIFML